MAGRAPKSGHRETTEPPIRSHYCQICVSVSISSNTDEEEKRVRAAFPKPHKAALRLPDAWGMFLSQALLQGLSHKRSLTLNSSKDP